ncbi:RecQ family ATP-dependent DNA helicase [Phnomibacter sp. MR]|uniref:RecQ family ATP-dependent DNA helicase n=1 Tax=Phnomibacter sp. MR TaxID=3042318 RepID=UPI003A8126A6
MSAAIHSILQSTFGYDQFRPGQQAIIEAVLDGNDTLALLPTGGGKSVCYQVPALAMPGICIVITPLIALMKDQVRQLHRRNVSALAIHSGMSFFEVKKALENAASGHFKFLYVSPERLQTNLFKEYLPAMDINLIAVDEAHCVSQWGYDFRPSYLQIAQLREELPTVPILALTASATPSVQQDIMEKLQFSMARKHFQQSFARPNVSFSAFVLPQKINKLLQVLQSVPGTALVYCRNRKRTREIAELLQLQGIAASYYHAGLSSEERSIRQDDWIQNKVRVMVCTNAFGMGIDKPDVRAVIHMDVPDSLEAYYQEAGRVGRDGKRAYAVLLYNQEELDRLQQLPEQKFLPIAQIQNIYQQIGNYLQLPVGQGEQQYFGFDLTRFCETFQLDATQVTHALQTLQTAGYMSFAEQVFIPSRVQITAGRAYLEQLENDKPALEPLIKLLLRTYEGILDFPVSIREKQLASYLRISVEAVQQQLKQLAGYQALEYEPLKDTPQLYFLYNRVPAAQVVIDAALYAQRKALYKAQIAAMVEYAVAQKHCRSTIIRRYFGDADITDCGICDNCLAAKQQPASNEALQSAKATIVSLLQKPVTSLQLRRSCLHISGQVFDAALQQLLEEEQVVQTADGSFVNR